MIHSTTPTFRRTLARSARARTLRALGALAASAMLLANGAYGGEQGFLETIHHHITRTSTVTENGDLNPYAVVAAPASAGKIQKGDVPVTNFNNVPNLDGSAGTIVDYNPAHTKTTQYA